MSPDRALVLLEMSPDLTAAQWSQRLDVTATEIRTFCAAQGLALLDAPIDGAEVALELVRRQGLLGVSWRGIARSTGLDVHQVQHLAQRRRGSKRVVSAVAGWLARTSWRAHQREAA